jgi:hypothetical protein
VKKKLKSCHIKGVTNNKNQHREDAIAVVLRNRILKMIPVVREWRDSAAQVISGHTAMEECMVGHALITACFGNTNHRNTLAIITGDITGTIDITTDISGTMAIMKWIRDPISVVAEAVEIMKCRLGQAANMAPIVTMKITMNIMKIAGAALLNTSAGILSTLRLSKNITNIKPTLLKHLTAETTSDHRPTLTSNSN